jgi:hypothetical protein
VENEKTPFLKNMISDICDTYIAKGKLTDKQRSVIIRYFHTAVKGFTRKTIGVRSQAYKDLELDYKALELECYEWKRKAFFFKDKTRLTFSFDEMKVIVQCN